MQPIRIFDTRPQHEALSEAMRAAFERVVSRGAFILGEEVSAFEHSCKTLLGADHAVGVSSGSDALFLALGALGIGPGDEVITTALSFIASTEAILRTGATPVFADIDPEHLCLCAASTERMLTPKTRAVLYVHLYGNTGSIAEHAQLCRRKGLLLVEDACQAFGSRFDDRAAGTWGSIGCYSFFPTKPLGGLGDGGLCVTHDAELASGLRALRSHGLGSSGRYESLGGNFRLDALQAALLSEKLPHVEAWRLEREKIAAKYCEAFRECRRITPPSHPAWPSQSAWSLYTVRIPNEREKLRDFLEHRAIESRVYYPSLLADQAAIVHRCRRDELTHASQASREVLSLPIYFGLVKETQQQIIDSVAAWSNGR